MAINMMCMDARCLYYWEDNCTRSLAKINSDGLCESFEEGISEYYKCEDECGDDEEFEKLENENKLLRKALEIIASVEKRTHTFRSFKVFEK